MTAARQRRQSNGLVRELGRDALMQWLKFPATGAVFRRLSFGTRFWLCPSPCCRD